MARNLNFNTFFIFLTLKKEKSCNFPIMMSYLVTKTLTISYRLSRAKMTSSMPINQLNIVHLPIPPLSSLRLPVPSPRSFPRPSPRCRFAPTISPKLPEIPPTFPTRLFRVATTPMPTAQVIGTLQTTQQVNLRPECKQKKKTF